MKPATCVFCEDELRGWSETTVDDQTFFVGSCPTCGDYTVDSRLWAERDRLSEVVKGQIAAFAQMSWQLTKGQQATDIAYDHVMKFFKD